jgi:hypothetical protein
MDTPTTTSNPTDVEEVVTPATPAEETATPAEETPATEGATEEHTA